MFPALAAALTNFEVCSLRVCGPHLATLHTAAGCNLAPSPFPILLIFPMLRGLWVVTILGLYWDNGK